MDAPMKTRATATTASSAVTNAGFSLDLPAELVLRIAEAKCTSRVLISISCTCTSWRDIIAKESESLWRMAALARFPLVFAIATLSYTTKQWNEIYQLQLRSEKVQLSPLPLDPSDFIVSYTITSDGKVVFDETIAIPVEQGPKLTTAGAWTLDTVPQWIKDAREKEWMDITHVLSVWISRDMKTVQLFSDIECFDGDENTSFFAQERLPQSSLLVQIDWSEDDGSLIFTLEDAYDNQLEIDILLRAFDSLLAAI